MAEVHREQWVTGSYLLDEGDDGEEEGDEEEGNEEEANKEEEGGDEEDLKQYLEKAEKVDQNFDKMINDQIQTGDIQMKVGRSTKWVMWHTPKWVTKVKAIPFVDIT